ncbi:hypothetical protein [Brevundimonas goettingensis]|uniref:Uncharacterized protein n=1 Tax=Brevundimonas goettingensis TaxID=2774190 RepID=A0A975GUP2_9CAUL|nr:hypothetical protein [Brevundimonas goettingensis]QTC90432.1 hypothetical protein IFJ75_14265 [Brevundimonas goettingensis]
MEVLQRIRDLAPAHDIVFILEDQPNCDCDDGYLQYGIYRRLHLTAECVRIARSPDFEQALAFLRAEMEAIRDERAGGEVVKSR